MSIRTYILPVGAYIHVDLPYCGYGLVVDVETVLDENGRPYPITHILWEDLTISSAANLRIPHRDTFWRIVAARVPDGTLEAARRLWRVLVRERVEHGNPEILESQIDADWIATGANEVSHR